MKKTLKLYLSSLLMAIALMTVAQAKKSETAAVQVCADKLMNDTKDAYSETGCPTTCTTADAMTWDGGKWGGKGTFNGWWTNPADGVDMGKCQNAICQCVPTTPPPPSCCDACGTAFDTCKTDGKLPIYSCSKNWETCASACTKAKPGTTCTPPAGAGGSSKKRK